MNQTKSAPFGDVMMATFHQYNQPKKPVVHIDKVEVSEDSLLNITDDEIYVRKIM